MRMEFVDSQALLFGIIIGEQLMKNLAAAALELTDMGFWPNQKNFHIQK